MSDHDLIRKSDALALAQNMNNGETAKAIARAIATLPAVTVGVKPLVWEQTADNAWVTQTYAIHQYWPHNNGHFRVHEYRSNVGEFGLKIYDTLQEAKEAAQAHHTARILAALEPVAAPDLSDPVTVHANMLRGTIAKPTVEQIIHLYGVDALTAALAPMIVREAGHEPS